MPRLAKKTAAVLISTINSECFLSDDPYSDYADVLKEFEKDTLKYVTAYDSKGYLVGYVIYREFRTHLESIRRAVTKSARGTGKGLELTKKLIAVSNKLKKPIYTYTSKTNLPSLNSNLKCGYKITEISPDWVYIKYTPKK